MKKILFTLLLVAGSFVAQAQNNLTVTSFSDDTSASLNYALAAGNLVDDKCVQVRGSIDEVATSEVFTYDASTRFFSRNGVYLTTFTVAEGESFAGAFDGTFNVLFSFNSAGEYVYAGEL